MKRLIYLCIFVILVISTSVFAQPATLWTQTYGGSDDDVGYCVQKTNDGGYIIAGSTKSFGAGDYDVYLIKTDATGTQEWYKTFGGSAADVGYSVQATSDGGYIIVGETWSFGAGSYDVYLIKTDAAGNEEWSQTFGGTDYDKGRFIQITSDGGFIIVGRTWSYGAGEYDVWLIKTDASGNMEWDQTFGGTGFEYGKDVQQASDGGYVVAGGNSSNATGDESVYIVKTDESGNEESSQIMSISPGVFAASVTSSESGGYVFLGTSSPGYGTGSTYLVQTDANCNVQSTQTYTHAGGESVGAECWSARGIVTLGSVIGQVDVDALVRKTDASGNTEWTQTYGGSGDDIAHSGCDLGRGGSIIVGSTDSEGAGGSDVWLICLDSETGVIELDLPQPLSFSLLPAYPNPFNPSTLIRFQVPTAGDVQLQIYDIQGNLVSTLTDGWQKAGSYEASFDGTDLSSGIYLARFTAGDIVQTEKLVLIK